ncbi:MAG: hypothetical protein U1E79_05380 [Ottowia sp.]
MPREAQAFLSFSSGTRFSEAEAVSFHKAGRRVRMAFWNGIVF